MSENNKVELSKDAILEDSAEGGFNAYASSQTDINEGALGFDLENDKQKAETAKKDRVSHNVITPQDSDGGTSVDWYENGQAAAGAMASQYDVDFLNFGTEKELINQYRYLSTIPEVDDAIENIISDAIVSSELESSVRLVLDEVDTIKGVTKKKMLEAHDEILNLLNFSTESYNIFRRWYIDGSISYQMLIDSDNPKAGIKELKYLEATKIKKIKKVIKGVEYIDNRPVDVIKGTEDYFLYDASDEVTNSRSSTMLEFKADSIAYATSGIVGNNGVVLSHLHKAIRVANQLRLLENSLVIYRLSRAPERRIFYVDVGNLPGAKANEYINNIVSKFKNKIKYDATTGNVTDSNDVMSIMEDYFLPRREGGRGTEVTTLPGGENLGQIEDVLYFQKKLFKSLNVPNSRLQDDSSFSLGRSSEISRDEVKFSRFIDRVRKRFTRLFLQLLKTQLILKEIITEDEWYYMKEDIHYDYLHDMYFTELKEIEIIQERLQILSQVDEYVGKYFSKEYIQKKILQFNDEDIEKIDLQIAHEKKTGVYDEDDEFADEEPSDNTPPEAKEEDFVSESSGDELMQKLIESLEKSN